MDFESLISRVALALGVGLLIGLERGWRMREAEPGGRTAGIRTFAISGLLGGIIGAIAAASGGATSVSGGLIVAVSFAAYAIAITLFSREENRAEGVYSATTAIAAMLTFALGVHALLGDVRITAAAAVAATGLLAIREELHGWIEKITWEELRSALVLLTMTFIALPIMPQAQIGPFGGVNPREIWIIAIALACVSFLGYVAVKYIDGRRGLFLAAAIGGLVSSTAVALEYAQRARNGEGSPRLLAAGVAAATAVSFIRVVAIAAALRPALLWFMGPPLMAAAAVAMGSASISAFLAIPSRDRQTQLNFRNPFSLWSVIGFALFLGAILLLGQAVGGYFGTRGVIAGAALVGFADVDSVTVSIAHLAPAPLPLGGAALAILAAAGCNTISKVAIALIVGRGRFAAATGALAAICILAGGIGLALTWTLLKP